MTDRCRYLSTPLQSHMRLCFTGFRESELLDLPMRKPSCNRRRNVIAAARRGLPNTPRTPAEWWRGEEKQLLLLVPEQK